LRVLMGGEEVREVFEVEEVREVIDAKEVIFF
jgi:hypothetical protein